MTRDDLERFNDNAVTRTQVQERDACLDIQARYRPAFLAIGDSCEPSSLYNETALEFERRMIRRLQPMSARFKDTDLSRIGHLPTLTAIGDAIRADAMAHARDPASFRPGELRAIVSMDQAGRPVTRYIGHPGGCWDRFTPPSRFAQNGLASFKSNGASR
jgi:hypothetical protein